MTNDLQIGRDAVTILGATSAAKARRRLVLSETLRPAESTDRWSQIAPAERLALSEAGCRGIALIEAADERDEALAIAVALRETLEEPGRTAALVTPDRALAIRVAAELDRWAVRVEDSAGCTLAETAMGRLARLAADAAAARFRPGPGPRPPRRAEVRLGLSREAMARAATALEIGVLRGPAPAPGLDGLREALRLRRGARTSDALPVRRLTDRDDDLAADLIERLAAAFGSFAAEAHGEGARTSSTSSHRTAAPSRCFWRSRRASRGRKTATVRRRRWRRSSTTSRLGRRADRGPLCRLSGLLRNPGAPARSALRRGRRIGA